MNLAERATIANVQSRDAQGYEQNHNAAAKGVLSSGVARRTFEEEHGRKVISDQSYIEQRKRLQSSEDSTDEA